MITIAVIFHSAYGHTRKQAEAVAQGVEQAGATAKLINVTEITEAAWAELDQVDGMIFGCPTYMGTISAEFKRFMDDSSKAWFQGLWRDKVAAGFTNSGSYSGDKLNTLIQFALFAMQHSMVWVGPGVMPASGQDAETANPEAVNRLGVFMGAMAQSADIDPELSPPSGDLLFAAELGKRVVSVVQKMHS